MIITRNIISSLEESFEVLVFPYQDLDGLEKIHQEHSIDRKRIFFDGKAEFVSEELAVEIVESDNNHILKKLEIPKQNSSYMVDLEEPKSNYKNYITGEFTEPTAHASFKTVVEKLHFTKFVLVYLKRTSLDSPGETLSTTSV